MVRELQQVFQAAHLGIRIGRRASHHKVARNSRILLHQPLDNRDGRIRLRADPKENFKFRVVLDKERLQVLFQTRYRTGNRLEQTKRREGVRYSLARMVSGKTPNEGNRQDTVGNSANASNAQY